VTAPQTLPSEVPQPGWTARLWALIKFLFCFEVGLFLLVFPWLRSWDINWLAASTPLMHAIWINSFFRGALSGIGLLNIWIGFGELFRTRPRQAA